jgi:hypothetical protein
MKGLDKDNVQCILCTVDQVKDSSRPSNNPAQVEPRDCSSWPEAEAQGSLSSPPLRVHAMGTKPRPSESDPRRPGSDGAPANRAQLPQ